MKPTIQTPFVPVAERDPSTRSDPKGNPGLGDAVGTAAGLPRRVRSTSSRHWRALVVILLAVTAPGCPRAEIDEALQGGPDLAQDPCLSGELDCSAPADVWSPPSPVCEPGSTWCESGGEAVLLCDDTGVELLREECVSGTVCAGEPPACIPSICTSGQTRCSDDHLAVLSCTATQTSWLQSPCGAGTACLDVTLGCSEVACTPGSSRCSEDRSEILGCSGDGTREDSTACDGRTLCVDAARGCEAVPCGPDTAPCVDGAVCREGLCAPSPFIVGHVVEVGAGDEVLLPAGTYAVVVSDASMDGPELLPFPLSLGTPSGGWTSPLPPPPRREALPGSGGWVCGTGHRPSPRPSGTPRFTLADTVPGDQRTFHIDEALVPERTGQLVTVLGRVRVWEDVTDLGPGALSTPFQAAVIAEAIDGQVVPRLQSLIGPLTDVDASGGVDLFVTDQIHTAAAYVSPATLWPPEQTAGMGVDFGEIVYVSADVWAIGTAEAIVAHELVHLIDSGEQMQMWIDSPPDEPSVGRVYAGEGFAELGASWSGVRQPNDIPLAVGALMDPGLVTMRALFLDSYLGARDLNAAGYGMASLCFEYVAAQAGGFSIDGAGALVTDTGGLAFVRTYPASPYTPVWFTLPDGRPIEEWWHDLAVALLLTSLRDELPGHVPAPEHRFPGSSPDPWGGLDGPALYWEDLAYGEGPILERVQWGARPPSLRAGGMAFLELTVLTHQEPLILSGQATRAHLVRLM